MDIIYRCLVKQKIHLWQEKRITPASTLTFVLARKLLGRSPAAPFFMQLSRQLCRRYARRQSRKCRLSAC